MTTNRSLEKRLESFDLFDSFELFDPKHNFAIKNNLSIKQVSLNLKQ